jgi:hypothetical protein
MSKDMSFMRADAKAALIYVVKEVLDFEDDSTLVLALKQDNITNIWVILTMSYDHINTLMYKDDQGVDNMVNGAKIHSHLGDN